MLPRHAGHLQQTRETKKQILIKSTSSLSELESQRVLRYFRTVETLQDRNIKLEEVVVYKLLRNIYKPEDLVQLATRHKEAPPIPHLEIVSSREFDG